MLPPASLRRVLATGPRTWLFLLRVAVTAAVVEAAARTMPLPRAARLAGARLVLDAPPAQADAWGLLDARDSRRCDLALRVVRRRPFRATCLRRALLLAHLLRHRDPALRVGVRKIDGRVIAHAWVEIDGATLDPGAGSYRTLGRPDGGPA